MAPMKVISISHLAAALLACCGCAPAQPTVTGTVRVDGELLEKGSITFTPIGSDGAIADGRGPGGGAAIHIGKYSVTEGLTAGRYRVEIQGVRKASGDKKMLNPVAADLIPLEVSAVPPEFNRNSTLVREVVPGPNPMDFILVTEKGGRKKP